MREKRCAVGGAGGVPSRKVNSGPQYYSLFLKLVRSRKVRRKETHCAFLDIRKAYDMLDRDALWKRLIDVGLRGKLWRVLRNLYDVVESSVLVGHRRTEWFQVEAGVRQGCILIFIDELSSESE